MRALAHNMKPSAYVGQKGLTDSLMEEIDTSLDDLELIKVKFVDFKEKEVKKELIHEIKERMNAELAGTIGHVAIYFRRNKDKEKQKITFPEQR